MSNKWIVGVVLLCIVAAVGFYYFTKDNTPTYSWQRTLKTEDHRPYDLSVCLAALKHTLGDNFKVTEPADIQAEVLNDAELVDPDFNYVFIGRKMHLSEFFAKSILEQVYNGGVAFISTEAIPQYLLDIISPYDNLTQNELLDDTIDISFMHPQWRNQSYQFVNKYKDESRNGSWGYFENPRSVEAAEITVIQGKYIDFILVPHGLGKLYLHLNPVLFSNVYMQTAQGTNYLKNALNHLPNKHTVFDLTVTVPKANTKSGIANKSVFTFIRENTTLNYAWWTLLGFVLLFLVVGGRRKQQSIPVISLPTNNSIATSEAIGQFYFQERDNAEAYEKEWNQFCNYLRTQFHMSAEKLDANAIAEKTGASIASIQNIFDLKKTVDKYESIKDKNLLKLNRGFAEFYSQINEINGKHRNR